MRTLLTALLALVWGCEVSEDGLDALVPDPDGAVADGTPADGAMDLSDGGVTCVPPAPPTACPDPPVRYGDIRPILDARCVSCHDTTPGGPWTLATYGHVADWEDTVRASMLDCSMPPLDSGVVMTTEERLVVLTWIRCGMPR